MPGLPHHFDREQREVEFSRALAFSDGVFGIAITLLVLAIDVPDIRGGDVEHQLLHQLDDLLPYLGAYFLSFAVVGLLWLRHHRLFARIRRVDPRTLVLNLVLLSFVALMPFSTNVVARFGDEPAGIGVYALNIAIATALYGLLWGHCARSGALGEQPSDDDMRLELVVRAIVPAGFLASIPVALLSTEAAQATWVVTVVCQRMAARRWGGEGRVERAGD